MFMIAAPAAYQSAIRVALPPAVSGEAVDRVTLRFMIPSDDKIILESKELNIQQIPEIVSLAKKKDPMADAIINADSKVTHGAVLVLIDALRSSGLDQVAIGVKQPKGSTR